MVDVPRAAGPELGLITREKLADVVRRHGIRLAVAFGSAVSGRTHPASDLDLAVLLDAPDESDWLGLLGDLQTVFPGREVDLLGLHRADPLIRWHALRQPKLLWGDPAELSRQRVYAWRRFIEYAPFFAREAEAVRRSIARWRDGDR